MPGQIAPAYVAVHANRLATRAGAGWFGGGADDGEGVHFESAVAVYEYDTVHASLDRSRRRGGNGFVMGWIGHPRLATGIPRYKEAMRLGGGLRHGLALRGSAIVGVAAAVDILAALAAIRRVRL